MDLRHALAETHTCTLHGIYLPSLLEHRIPGTRAPHSTRNDAFPTAHRPANAHRWVQ